MAALFEAAADNAPLTLDDFVPAGVPPLTEVIHEGKNSLRSSPDFKSDSAAPAKARASSGATTTRRWPLHRPRLFRGAPPRGRRTHHRLHPRSHSQTPALARDSLELCAPGALHLPRDPRSVASGESPRVRGARDPGRAADERVVRVDSPRARRAGDLAREPPSGAPGRRGDAPGTRGGAPGTSKSYCEGCGLRSSSNG